MSENEKLGIYLPARMIKVGMYVDTGGKGPKAITAIPSVGTLKCETEELIASPKTMVFIYDNDVVERYPIEDPAAVLVEEIVRSSLQVLDFIDIGGDGPRQLSATWTETTLDQISQLPDKRLRKLRQIDSNSTITRFDNTTLAKFTIPDQQVET